MMTAGANCQRGSIQFLLNTHSRASVLPANIDRASFPRPCSENVGRRDAADEPTGTYLRRVSEQGLGKLTGRVAQH
jgi:hypothetical protein